MGKTEVEESRDPRHFNNLSIRTHAALSLIIIGRTGRGKKKKAGRWNGKRHTHAENAEAQSPGDNERD